LLSRPATLEPPLCSAREALRQCLPELLRNPGFTACLKSDDTTRRWLAQLLINVGFPEAAAQLSNEMLQPTPLQGQ
jgi:CCR4-NOT transcription complex subunit 9